MASTAGTEDDAPLGLDFNEEDMEPGDTAWKHLPAPPEMLVACWIDSAGAAHYYLFECVGTIEGERAWVKDGSATNIEIEFALQDNAGVVIKWPDVTNKPGFIESAWQHSFESDDRYRERMHSSGNEN